MAFYNLDNLCKIIGRSKHKNILPQDKSDANRIAKDLYKNTNAQPLDIQKINQILQRIDSKYRMRINAFQWYLGARPLNIICFIYLSYSVRNEEVTERVKSRMYISHYS